MKNILLILITLIFLGGCYTRMGVYNESDPRYDEVSVYIDYNFQCGYCYYETYYCFNCGYWHTHITSWCHHHYGWYNDWYVVYYYHPHSYYYNHWHSHYYYADYNRHYRHDRDGLRNMSGRNYTDNKSVDRVKTNENKYPRINDKQNKNRQLNTSPPVKRNDIIKTNPPVKRNNTIKTNPPVKRNSDTKQNRGN